MAKWTEADIPDQTGRTALVTGANSGLGLRTAEVLGARGARVLLACRSPERGQRVGHGSWGFAFRPHLNADYFPMATMEMMERAAAKLDYPLYAIDDETAIKVVDGEVEVVSEGEWRLFDG